MNHFSIDQLQKLLDSAEDEHLEFKEAKFQFEFDKLLKYCVAFANEGGGVFVLGVSDKQPRKIVGTQAFRDLNHVKKELIQKLNLKIETQEILHQDGRIVIFHIPSRSLGNAINCEGAYWMRGGESLIPMTQDMLKRIFEEVEVDFSAQICPRASIEDLDPRAIENFRTSWLQKSNNKLLANLSIRQLLLDAELITQEGITYAALILLGTSHALHGFLPQAEIVFEYRSNETPGPAQQRIEYQGGFFLAFDELWKTINLRNDNQHYQSGFFVWNIPTFNERVVREAILNAVSHRNYLSKSSIFIRQYSRRIEIQNPGGLPHGVTPENILWNQSPRNRLIADVFVKCALVERAGQGVNLMFELSIRQGKPIPEYLHSDTSQVFLTLPCEIQDPAFLQFLEKIGQERLCTFSIEDFLILDLVQREASIPQQFQSNVRNLLENGLLEKYGRGRGVHYVFSRRYYDFIGKKGAYTRQRGLDRETNKQLLLKHIREHDQQGSKLQELMQVLPMLSNDQVKKLLQELKSETKITYSGAARKVLWYPCNGAEIKR